MDIKTKKIDLDTKEVQVRIVLNPLAYIIFTSHQKRLLGAPHPFEIRFTYINKYRNTMGIIWKRASHLMSEFSNRIKVMANKHMNSKLIIENLFCSNKNS